MCGVVFDIEGNGEFQNDGELGIYSLLLFDQNMPIRNAYAPKMEING